MSANCEKISFFNSFIILVYKLLGPVDLFSFNFDIISFISSLFVSVMKNELLIR